MNLIDRYVKEVGRHLPFHKGRADIERELRSTLEDMLEDRASAAGRTRDEGLEIELLKEYGPPRKVASTYNPHPYLIGPGMFPLFTMVTKIVLSVLTIVLLVATGIQIATLSPMTAAQFLGLVGKGMLGIVSGAVSAFGNIVLVFAILERFVPSKEFGADEEEWDPAALMKEPESDEVKAWEPILAIVVTFIALSVFNFKSQWIGFYFYAGGEWEVVPVLTRAFFRWLPWINAAWIAEIVLNGMLYRAGRWQASTRLLSVAARALQIVIGYFLITGPAVAALPPQALEMVRDADGDLQGLFQQGIRALIALIMFLEGIDVAKTAYKLAAGRPSSGG
jgi:hypothetical protein